MMRAGSHRVADTGGVEELETLFDDFRCLAKASGEVGIAGLRWFAMLAFEASVSCLF